MPDFSSVIKEDKDPWTVSILGLSLYHESSTDCEGGRKVSLFKRGVCGAVVFVNFFYHCPRKSQEPSEWGIIELVSFDTELLYQW